MAASRSSGNAFIYGAKGLRFKSGAGQIKHRVVNGSPPLQHFFEGSCVLEGAITRKWARHGRQLVTRFGLLYYSEHNKRFDLNLWLFWRLKTDNLNTNS